MIDCIYSPYCTYKQCDLACPTHAEISYWMERCNIDMNNPVLHASPEKIKLVRNILDDNRSIQIINANDTVLTADLICYCSICLYGKNTALNGGIYNLNYSEYIESIKRSWQTKYESEELEFMRIWSNSSDRLIISHMDYVKFNDFECQTLLTLMQSRDKPNKHTYIVVPKDLNQLYGNGHFYSILLNKFRSGGIKHD